MQSEPGAGIDPVRFGPFQVGIAALCALVAMLDGFDTQSIAYVAPRIAEDWHLAPSAFGPIFGAGLLGLTIGAFVLSSAADRFGRKIIILLSVAIFGIFALLTARVRTMDELLALRVLTGIGLGGAMPNIIALTNEYAPARYKATLVTVMFCGFPLGSTIGGLVTAPLIADHGWTWVFLLGGAMPLALLPVLAWLLPESARFLALRPGQEPRIAAILRKASPELSVEAFVASVRAESQGSQTPRFPVAALFAEGRAGRTILVWTAFFMNLLVMYFLVNWLPSLLKSLGLPLKTAILSTALLNLGGVVGGVVLGRLIDRRDPYLILSAAYFAAALFIAVIALAGPNTALLLAAATACGFGVSGAQIGLNAVTANAYPTAIRSTGIGWALGVGRIGSILGPTIGGALLALGWTPQSLLLTAIAPALVAALAVFALRRT
ncbi:MFS transporter [Caulobacter sp. 602-1]|uniref:MFS transporter n=1 Tax=Caulobacter sp. 602-1 TaxID=2492472 RepID=UPI0018F6C1C5|nr:MFS transporter [Caulobacter sp. 602-1]